MRFQGGGALDWRVAIKREKRHNKVAMAPLMDGKTMGQNVDRVGVGDDTRRVI